MRKKRGTYHHGQLRQAALDAALAIVARDGVNGLSLRDVARRLGVSHQAPYRHFADKGALLDAIATDGFVMLANAVRAASEREPEPVTRLIECGFAYIEFARQHVAHYRVMFAEPDSSRGMPPGDETGETPFHLLVEVIAGGQARGKFRPAPPRDLALSAFAFVHGLAMLLIDRQLPPLGDAAVRGLLHHHVHGITV